MLSYRWASARAHLRDVRHTKRTDMLFLFDIDGTLLRRMPPAHRQALCDAAQEVFGALIAPGEMGPTAGMTDTAIARRMLLGASVSERAIAAGLADFHATAAEAYQRHVPDDLTSYYTPHALEALDWLRERKAALGLVTGNIERIAWIKLAAARLDAYFACGAFGDEAEAREALPPLALARARQAFGRDFAPEETYIVGDTPADISCGVAHGLRTIAVATGPAHALDDLRGCAPDHLFADLSGVQTLRI
jgi:phosphoglycolate phosphatase-like HAD superfamily hydrolase